MVKKIRFAVAATVVAVGLLPAAGTASHLLGARAGAGHPMVVATELPFCC